MKLTEKQSLVYEFIKQFIDSKGLPPTRAEIAKGLGFRSVNAAVDHLRVLQKKGVIKLEKGTSRGIHLSQASGVADKALPVVGKVAAGLPISALENRNGSYAVAADMFTPSADYLLQIEGESMRDIGMLNGDLLAVHKTSIVKNGQIAVIRVDDEVTVKRFIQDQVNDYRVTLLAENKDFAPIVLDLRKQSVEIEGIAVGLLRNNHDYFCL